MAFFCVQFITIRVTNGYKIMKKVNVIIVMGLSKFTLLVLG